MFQLELIDRGAGDAEIIFRYENIQDPLTLLTVSFEMGFISTDDLSNFVWFGDSQDGQDQLDDRPGNTGVDGVWQFGLVDGALVQDDRLRVTQTGTEENDHLSLQSQGGRLLGLAGDDVLNGAISSAPATLGAILNGGDGNDQIGHGNAADTVFGGAGDDQVVSHEGAYWPEINFADYIHGMDGNDTLSGGFGGDTVAGGAGDDVISGGMDDDFLFGGEGNDFLYGGRGRDNVWAVLAPTASSQRLPATAQLSCTITTRTKAMPSSSTARCSAATTSTSSPPTAPAATAPGFWSNWLSNMPGPALPRAKNGSNSPMPSRSTASSSNSRPMPRAAIA
ncbi:hypothetical protein OEZ49_06835 [Ruegeria sp. WL0004]|uniref:Calcium-binding protein n=1 Tax=Ruegeria marisflavi TaxID=2984152 RepID=A0ABT2WNK6_9RHOB|nr:hypothetical protein [Ruegeria sp. WL0004]